MCGAISRDIGTHAQEDNREGPGLGHTDQAMFVCYQNSTQPFHWFLPCGADVWAHPAHSGRPTDRSVDGS